MTHEEKYSPRPKVKDVTTVKNWLWGVTKQKQLDFRESPEYIINLAKKCGIEVDTDNVDTNGWQLDWWLKGTYDGRPLLLSGSAWYGFALIEWE